MNELKRALEKREAAVKEVEKSLEAKSAELRKSEFQWEAKQNKFNMTMDVAMNKIRSEQKKLKVGRNLYAIS